MTEWMKFKDSHFCNDAVGISSSSDTRAFVMSVEEAWYAVLLQFILRVFSGYGDSALSRKIEFFSKSVFIDLTMLGHVLAP